MLVIWFGNLRAEMLVKDDDIPKWPVGGAFTTHLNGNDTVYSIPLRLLDTAYFSILFVIAANVCLITTFFFLPYNSIVWWENKKALFLSYHFCRMCVPLFITLDDYSLTIPELSVQCCNHSALLFVNLTNLNTLSYQKFCHCGLSNLFRQYK